MKPSVETMAGWGRRNLVFGAPTQKSDPDSGAPAVQHGRAEGTRRPVCKHLQRDRAWGVLEK